MKRAALAAVAAAGLGLAAYQFWPSATPEPTTHEHVAYLERLDVLESRDGEQQAALKALSERIEQLQATVDSLKARQTTILVDWPHRFDRHEQRIGNIEHKVWGEQP